MQVVTTPSRREDYVALRIETPHLAATQASAQARYVGRRFGLPPHVAEVVAQLAFVNREAGR